MGTRREARELAVRVLFHLEYHPDDPETAFELISEHFEARPSVRPFARMLVLGVYDRLAEMDALIRAASRNWRLERMARIDRSILRMAAYELSCLADIPAKVSIDEAVELGKNYGSGESGGFINGIMDSIYNRLVREGRLPPKPEVQSQHSKPIDS